ncbi:MULTISPECIES: ADP-ribosylglycohydrolase family protein [unclassified Streptomyces]|uniref:ADP-ribosylglycohydrolase family protein n=1 Tax=unclassified Streptomyces TaxID=2593676 RepID=UPI0022B6E7A9|nr:MULTISPECIES: ADP-ribosylglycohydrolase family protein [unclassified Streptomyces]MCZ7416115.1 ADP-ribosylglycohydrolase family protein [Streptomyces sp. WMMC897]MCZ7434077.1 ADP-ribosylglycohydrolase family protein [Streptomyces sp. WMMC1477]
MTADSARLSRARASLRGLSVGDALGSQFFVPDNYPLLARREPPPGPWQWTDDTEMAASVVAVLHDHGTVDQDSLASAFAVHHDFDRGYGPAVNRMLRLIRQEGAGWRELAAALFDGRGSWGNGAAMRVAPIGAWFAEDPARAAAEAERSAFVTHQHREAVCGAMAVAAAAALRARADPWERGSGAELLSAVVDLVPRSAVGAGLRRAVDLLDYVDVSTVAAVLGCGRRTSAHDTVPFALWAVARHGGSFTDAIWTTAQAGGDVDTTCAIVGGILAASAQVPPPADWAAATEDLPEWTPGVAE